MKLYKNIFTKLTSVLMAVSALLLSSCILDSLDDDGGRTTPQEGDVRILVQIPGSDIPSTRAMGNKENEIKTIDVLVFKTVNGVKVFNHHSQGVIISNSLSGGNVEFSVSLVTESSPCDIAVIANARDIIDRLVDPGSSSGISVNDTKVSVLGKLSMAKGSKWGADGNSSDGYTSIPMYGEVKDVSITSASSYSTSLRRMLARIDIRNMTGSGLEISKVHLWNYMNRGYIAPAWNSSGVVATDVVPKEPNISNSWVTSSNYFSYDLSAAGSASGYSQVYEGEIYTFESAVLEYDENTSKRIRTTCLIIEGYLNGNTSDPRFFRVDFTYAEDDVETGIAKGDYMPLLRNHKYIVEIELAEGKGYDSMAEARYSYTQKSNLHVHTLYYDEGKIKDIAYNGRNMLGVESSELVFDWLGEAQTDYVFTDYYNGWTYSVTYPSGNTGGAWLIVNRDTANGSSGKANLIVEPPVSFIGTPERVAYIRLKAGDLEHTIKVVQEAGRDPLPYVKPVANSYMVKPGSDPIFIPIDPANNPTVKSIIGAERDPIHGTIMLDAPLVWSDQPVGLRRDGPVRYAKTSSNQNTDQYYVIVFPGIKEGNAVVGVNTRLAGGERPLHWTWHIWNTAYDPETDYKVSSLDGTKWMDRNLGALSNKWQNKGTVGDPVTGLYYQWGRKDPFPNTNAPAYVEPGREMSVTTDSPTLLATIRNPLLCFANGDWTGSNPENGGAYSWSYNGSKTVFDPCPAGWRLPYDSAWGTPAETVVGDISSLAGRIFMPTGQFLPAAGRRHNTTIEAGSITGPAYSGSYWSATPLITYSNEMRFDASGGALSPLSRNYMLPVRCVKERFM